jgi:hypothetical protein
VDGGGDAWRGEKTLLQFSGEVLRRPPLPAGFSGHAHDKLSGNGFGSREEWGGGKRRTGRQRHMREQPDRGVCFSFFFFVVLLALTLL